MQLTIPSVIGAAVAQCLSWSNLAVPGHGLCPGPALGVMCVGCLLFPTSTLCSMRMHARAHTHTPPGDLLPSSRKPLAELHVATGPFLLLRSRPSNLEPFLLPLLCNSVWLLASWRYPAEASCHAQSGLHPRLLMFTNRLKNQDQSCEDRIVLIMNPTWVLSSLKLVIRG